MTEFLNIYCDESCHLENDNSKVMVLGALTCPQNKTSEVSSRIKEIKIKYGFSTFYEIKWTKVSPSKKAFFNDIIDYFFDDDDLSFRAITCKKDELDHIKYNNGSHDEWYYKMYFLLLRRLINEENNYYIYLDIKDTKSADKKENLHNILCNANYDFSRKFINKIQHIRSHEVQLMQLADLLIGAVSYESRELFGSDAKLQLIARLKQRANLNTISKSNYSRKMNIFSWTGDNGV